MKQPSARKTAQVVRPARHALSVLAASLVAAFGVSPGMALAQTPVNVLPTGAQVVVGTAPIEVAGTQMTVANTPGAVIDWQSFSIGVDNRVRFEQQSADSKVLNRVVGNDLSSILGTLSSNGEVWLVNPNGVVFGADAKIDVGSLVASTLGVTNTDFATGSLRFGGDAAAATAGRVLNEAQISTMGGRVLLVGGSVRNDGIISATGGQIVLAAGRSVEMIDSGTPNVTVRISAPDNEAINVGQLLANDGSIDLHGAMVNQQGFVRADSMESSTAGRVTIRAQNDLLLDIDGQVRANSSNGAGGKVVLEAVDGENRVLGGVSAIGAGGDGGQVQLLGRNVHVESERGIDASGLNGGQVLISGSAGGAHLERGTVVRARAGYGSEGFEGNGGEIVIHSEQLTSVYGALEVGGGMYSGRIETSGLQLDARPDRIDGRSGWGQNGSWLAQAGDLTVIQDWGDGRAPGGRAPEGYSTVSNRAVSQALQDGMQVTLKASGQQRAPLSGNIVVEASIELDESAVNYGVLRLQANNDIDVASEVRIASSASLMEVHLEADADTSGLGDIRLAKDSEIDTGGGDLSLSGQRVTLNGASIASGWDWGSGALAISAAAVALTDSVLNATGKMTITGTNAIGMFDSTLSSSTWGDAIVISTDTLATIRSSLSTPEGRWLIYLDSVPEAFAADEFDAMDYQFVQVGAGATGTPVRSGVGQHGVIIREAMNVEARVNADRAYDGGTDAEFSEVVSDDLVSGFKLARQSEGPVVGDFDDKNAGVGKSITASGASFGLYTTTDQQVYGATTDYIADITPKQVSASGLVAQDKVYDATRNATITGTLAGIVDGDDVRLGAASGLFADKNVGTNKTVTLTGGALSGADGANYVLGGGTLEASITPLTIGAAGLAAVDKVYDGTRSASVSGALSAVLGEDDVTLNGAVAQFDDKNAGSGKTVTLSGGRLGGEDAGNYVLGGGPILLSADITRRPVDVSGLSARDKIYDGSRDANLDGAVANFVEGDDVRLDGALAQFDDKNVGAGKTVTISGAALGGADAGNYELGASPTLRASITARAIAATGLSAQDKIYDGTRDATVTGTLSGVLDGDSVRLEGATGQFADKDAGTDKTVTINGGALSGLDAGNYTLDQVGSSTAQADITPRTITAAGLAAIDKVYDGTRDAALQGSLTGVLEGDSVSLDGATAQFADKNVGSGKAVTLAGGALGGDDAGNYTLDRASSLLNASITPRMLGVSGLSARDKVYDGSRNATLSGSLSGIVDGDNVSLDGAVAQFDDRNAGAGKTVTVSGALLGGTDAGNYQLSESPNLRASITPRAIAATSLSALDKVYDGTRDAIVSGSLSGVLAGDSVRLEGATGQFADKNAGQGKTVTITGGALGGVDAGNYTLDGAGSGTAQADITQRAITANGLAARDKVYDGTRDAVLSGSLTGVLAGDSVSLDGATGLFADKNAGNGKTVTVSGATLGGADAGNYALAAPSGVLQASITPRQLAVSSLDAQDKVYDGTRNATVTGLLSNTVAGDQVSLEASGQFDNRNAGIGKTVTVNGLLAGADAANYRLDLPATTNADVTRRALDIVLTGTVSKEYDTTTGASVAADGFALSGQVAGDQVAVRGPAQGSFGNANAGQGKLVTASGVFEISGGDAANYRVGGIDLTGTSNQVTSSASGNVGTITPATLVYQANPSATISGLDGGLGGTVTGFKGGDNLANSTSGQLQWTSPITPGSAPGAHPIYGGGLASQNYVLVQAPANATALELKPGIAAGAPQQRSQEAATQAINSAVRSALLTFDPRAITGALFDRSNPAAARAFGPLQVSALSQNELAELLAQRRDFKRKLFADAVYKLSIDPSLADVQPCATAEEASSGSCRITQAQLAMMHAARDQAAASAAAPVAGTRARARVASVPQIERKIAVLVGINDYGDKDIPQLENAIPDADGVGKVFAEKLGYEVRVARNPDKAGIIRLLNNLAAEVGANDSVVVYFAGHGYSLEENGAGYWLASDSTASDPKGWISNSDIAQLLSSMRSKQMTLISDSCYSGAFAREGLGAVGKNVTVDDVLAKRSVVVLSSGGDEPVADEGKGGHSIFAWNLMQAMDSVTAWTPGSTVYADVQAAVRKEFPQTPKYGSLTAAGHQAGGDYLFEMRSN